MEEAPSTLCRSVHHSAEQCILKKHHGTVKRLIKRKKSCAVGFDVVQRREELCKNAWYTSHCPIVPLSSTK